MPISIPVQTKRVSQGTFGNTAYELMRHVFEIHDSFGRFFKESIYKRELAARLSGILLEVPVTVSFGDFSKVYRLDVLKDVSGLFEFKCVDAISGKHRSQTMNYLLLIDLEHAKIINMRPEKVEHEFVNCSLRLCDLHHPKITCQRWDPLLAVGERFRELLLALVADWGAGLELSLYEAAVCHFMHGTSDVAVTGAGELGVQSLRLAEPGIAFKLTAFKQRNETFAVHARRLIQHTDLRAILWADLCPDEIRFETIA